MKNQFLTILVAKSCKNITLVFTVIFLTIAIITLSSCLPVEDESINTELFTNKEELKTIAANLTSGMSEAEVLEKVNIPIESFVYMSTEELQRAVYGNSMVTGSPRELERFKERLLTYKGYYLPYRNLESEGTIGLGKMKVNKKGHDLRFVLIFEDGILLKSSVEGNLNVNHNEDKYMWNSILKRGTGIGF